jgi:uncharacterized protein
MQPDDLKDAAIIIFARYPAPGKVKTRLADALGKEKAADFYRTCAKKTFDECRKAGGASYIYYSDGRDAAAIKKWVGPGFHFAPQIGQTLSERLTNSLEEVFRKGAKRVMVVASDTPDLSTEILRKAANGLAHYNVVIGPAYDGGYYLMAMKKVHAGLFEGITWSTGRVLEETLAAARRLGLTVLMLPWLRDIDTLQDVNTWLRTADPENPVTRTLYEKS